jgi:ubiquitin-protein ligase
MSTIYERRVEQEWRLLQSLAEANPGVVVVGEKWTSDSGEIFAFSLLKTGALIETPEGLTLEESHQVAIQFPRFYPSIPLEASLARPVFHPNVNPENGFVCLWNRLSAGDTVVEAVAQLQRVITFQLVNQESDHRMQPAALSWFNDPARPTSLPLACQSVRKPEGFGRARTYRKLPPDIRRRLS